MSGLHVYLSAVVPKLCLNYSIDDPVRGLDRPSSQKCLCDSHMGKYKLKNNWVPLESFLDLSCGVPLNIYIYIDILKFMYVVSVSARKLPRSYFRPPNQAAAYLAHNMKNSIQKHIKITRLIYYIDLSGNVLYLFFVVESPNTSV